MRQLLLREGASELSYEIRGIVKKAEQLQHLGETIYWENIGDPIQKHVSIPKWMKAIISELTLRDETYGYSHSKGLLETRQFLAERNNSKGGVQIKPGDITFFNGLGDAIQKIYQYLRPTARVIGPSPAYSTHSSAEAAHANHHPITYELDPNNNWYPDLDDLELKVKYNPNIVGIMVINPDNPTGMVYPKALLEGIVEIARKYLLFLVFDEIYMNLIYNGAKKCTLAEIIEDVPGISLKGISKEFPWPGARCGWTEYYNRELDEEFSLLCETIDNAKMIEVSSTRLPQRAIPLIMSHPEYESVIEETNLKIGEKSQFMEEALSDISYVTFNRTNGAFYNTIIFKEGVLNDCQKLEIYNPEIKSLLENWLQPSMPMDQRFVYFLLAAKQVCVVPVSSFASKLFGFRITLLEEDREIMKETFKRIKEGVIEYCESA
ncbi:MAG: pyridoxal phosphate-dependent aminotransferase [Bacteroidota bacterium]